MSAEYRDKKEGEHEKSNPNLLTEESDAECTDDAKSLDGRVLNHLLEREDIQIIADKIEQRIRTGPDIPVIQRLTAINTLMKTLCKPDLGHVMNQPGAGGHRLTITSIKNKTCNKVEVALTTFLANN